MRKPSVFCVCGNSSPQRNAEHACIRNINSTRNTLYRIGFAIYLQYKINPKTNPEN